MVAAPYEVMTPQMREQAQRRIAELEQENSELKQFLRWEDTLFAVAQDDMSAAQKITHRFIILNEYRRLTFDGTDRRQVETYEIAKKTGRSVSGVRADIKHLVEELDLYDRSYVKEFHEDAPPITHMFLAPLERNQYPRLYKADHPRQHGGAGRSQGRGGKKQCDHCGSENLDLYQNYQCRDCNHIGTVEITHQHGDDTPRNQVDFRQPFPDEQEPEPEQSSIIESSFVVDEAPNNQVASLITNKIDTQLDCLEDEAPNNQVDFRHEEDEAPINQVDSFADGEANPSIPSSVPGFPDMATQEAAIALYVDIAGVYSSHVEMCKDAGQLDDEGKEIGKYRTIHSAVQRGDILNHLRGFKTKGATLRQGMPNMTRALPFDADNQAGWRILEEAAAQLAASGFLPILEPSPASNTDTHAGGGHLWTVYDNAVNIYSAYQTMLEIAPQLARIQEYWPSGDKPIRLPGGKYVKPGVDEWCSLYDAYGNNLSTDGISAALVLLRMQTPHRLVKWHIPPTELVLQSSQPTKTTSKPGGKGYLEKDVSSTVIAEFNDSHDWDEIAALAGGFNREKKFLASWRGDRKPNVSVDPKTDLAKDFSSNAWSSKAMDRYEVWCHIQGGTGWEAFKRKDTDQRCAEYRRRNQARIAS